MKEGEAEAEKREREHETAVLMKTNGWRGIRRTVPSERLGLAWAGSTIEGSFR